ncbi:hypothetical protein CMV_023393 [Castanea mollissima]|uniref:Uncharacterized protein n=1 Tax=Castanea mollissima TaxID=60419 RepID=A0A8J4VJG1_9ROSI|nr:hypothetical protein CMV_023393 [Castanea mollissima]
MPSLTIQDDFKFGNWFHWKVVLLGYICGFMFGLTMEYLVFSKARTLSYSERKEFKPSRKVLGVNQQV